MSHTTTWYRVKNQRHTSEVLSQLLEGDSEYKITPGMEPLKGCILRFVVEEDESFFRYRHKYGACFCLVLIPISKL